MAGKNKPDAPSYCGKKLWILEFILVLVWYGTTALESWWMGFHPLARRAFTVMDFVLFVLLLVVVVWLNFKCRKRVLKR